MMASCSRHNLYGILIWIYIVGSVMVAAASTSSRFLTLPQSQTVIENDAVAFDCVASPMEGGVQYSWLHNGQPLSLNKRVHQHASQLRVDAVDHTIDAGDYVCIATSVTSGARQASPPARLSIIWLRSASVQLLSNKRNEAMLKCHVEGASGDGMLEIEWYRNSEKLSTWQNIALDENRLIIRAPSSQDNGLYRCIATNAAGRVMSKKGYVFDFSEMTSTTLLPCMPRLRLNQKMSNSMLNQIFLCRGKRGGAGGTQFDGNLPQPEDVAILQGPAAKQIVKEHEPSVLQCAYKLAERYAEKSVQLRWRKDGKIIRQVSLTQQDAVAGTTTSTNLETMPREDARIVLARENGSLIFTSVLASDAGLYACQLQVEAYAAVTSELSELQVIEQLKFAPQPTSKNLELGTLGKVHCKAQGTPVPQVKWLKDVHGDAMALPDSVADHNGTLVFKNVSAEHRGNYTCVASNAQGQVNATVAINVVIAPRFVVAPEGPVESVERSVAVIHCQAIGDPKPTIQWDKDLRYLSENSTDRQRFKFLENGTLEIRDLQAEDEGYYGCTIGNSAGLKRVAVRLVVKAASDGFLTEESEEGFLITRAVLITMFVALAYIVLVFGLMLWCRYRRQARKARLADLSKDNAEPGETGKTAENEPCLPDKQNTQAKKLNGNNNPGNDAQKSDDTACSNQSKISKKSHVYDQLSLPRSSISELIQIGRGEFGDVFVGKIRANVIAAQSPDDKDIDTEKHSSSENGNSSAGSGSAGSAMTAVSTLNEKRRSKTSMDDIEAIKEETEPGSGSDANETTVAGKDEYKLVLVKALNKIKDEHACQEFRRQIEMLRAITHKGVVRLFGLCREKDPHYMVLEYTDWGDLKQFLLATAGKVNTSTNSSAPPPLKTGQVLAVAYQIARGMDAIYRARFIHKDLATRNCVISSDFIVKVSYPALCKDKYSREYHKHRNMLLPIRWLAPECIQEDEYTTKSDIFAFGVVVWELFNQATKLPFEELSNEEIMQRSQTAKLEWAIAEGTPESLKEILTNCWHTNPKERPSFSQLCSALSKSMQNGDK